MFLCRRLVCSLTEKLFVIVVCACFLFGTTAHRLETSPDAKGKSSKEPLADLGLTEMTRWRYSSGSWTCPARSAQPARFSKRAATPHKRTDANILVTLSGLNVLEQGENTGRPVFPRSQILVHTRHTDAIYARVPCVPSSCSSSLSRNKCVSSAGNSPTQPLNRQVAWRLRG